MKRRMLTIVLAGMLAVTALAGCSSIKNDKTAITVGDTEISAGEANFYARFTQAQYETYYSAYMGEDMWNTEAAEGETYEESVKTGIQKTLETMVLLEQHMEDYNVTLSDAEKKVIEDTAAKFDENNALEDKELVSGDKKIVERVLTLMAIQQKMAEAIQAGADTEVSDDEAAQKSMDYVYFAYKTTNEAGESTDLSDDEKAALKSQAEAVASGLKEGKDLTELAKTAGAEVQKSTFDAESQAPNADLVKAADALKEGETTDVIETEAGCFVAKLTSLLDREATDAKKNTIVEERKSKLYQDKCDEWLKEADIKVEKKIWDKIKFGDLKVTMKVEERVPYTDEAHTHDHTGDETGTEAE